MTNYPRSPRRASVRTTTTRRESTTLDRVLAFLERWRGIPVLLGVTLVVLNFVVGLLPGGGWLAWHDWLLHLGLVVALVGIVLTEAL